MSGDSLQIQMKALLHEPIFPATCNATDDESIMRQVAEYMLHAAKVTLHLHFTVSMNSSW